MGVDAFVEKRSGADMTRILGELVSLNRKIVQSRSNRFLNLKSLRSSSNNENFIEN